MYEDLNCGAENLNKQQVRHAWVCPSSSGGYELLTCCSHSFQECTTGM